MLPAKARLLLLCFVVQEFRFELTSRVLRTLATSSSRLSRAGTLPRLIRVRVESFSSPFHPFLTLPHSSLACPPRPASFTAWSSGRRLGRPTSAIRLRPLFFGLVLVAAPDHV